MKIDNFTVLIGPKGILKRSLLSKKKVIKKYKIKSFTEYMIEAAANEAFLLNKI